MQTLYLTVNWFFGIAFWVWGVAGLRYDFLSSLICILISALLLPPVRIFIYNRTKLVIPSLVRFMAVVCLFSISIVLSA